MTTRRPLVLVSGAMRELPSGDTLPDLDVSGALTTYTPSIVVNSGSLTSATAEARWKQLGKFVFIHVSIIITTNGTAAGWIQVNLPVNSRNVSATSQQPICGVESALTGAGLIGHIANNAATLRIRKTDGTYPGASGAVLNMSGWYEAA